MNARLTKALCALCIVFLGCLSAMASLSWPPDAEVSVESLIDNIKSFIEKNPDDADALHSLGQVYSFSYATGARKFNVYTRSRPYWRPALGDARIPHSSPANTGEIAPEKLDYLVQSIYYYNAAIAKKSEDKFFWLGVAYNYKQAANHAAQIKWPFTDSKFDEEAKRNEKNKRFWEDHALAAYRKAFFLDTGHRSPFHFPSVAELAGDGIIAILHQREQLTEIEHKELRRIKRAVSAMQPLTGLGTPIVATRPSNLPFDTYKNGKGVISGKVVSNDTGKPVGGVTVQLLEDNSKHIVPVGGLTPLFEAVTSRNGKFTIKKVPDGNWYVGVRDETIAPLADDVPVSIDGKKKIKNIEFNVREGYSIEGRVYADEDFEKGVPGLILEARTNYYSNEISDRGFRTTTDVDGKFHFGGLPPGMYDIFPAPQQPYVKCSMLFKNDKSLGNEIPLKYGQHLTDIEFQVKPSYKVTGVVVDRNGIPVADAAVGFLYHSNYEPKNFNAITYTNREGKFTIISLEDEKGELSAHKDGLLATPTPYTAVSALEDKESKCCTLMLARPSRINGQVVDKHGNPLPKASLHLDCYHPDSSTSKSLEMDGQGHFDTGDLLAGQYSFSVHDFDSDYSFESFHGDKFFLGSEEIMNAYKIVIEDAVKSIESTIHEELTLESNTSTTTSLADAFSTVLEQMNPGKARNRNTPTASLDRFGTVAGRVTVGGEPLSEAIVGRATGTRPLSRTDAQGNYVIGHVSAGEFEISAAWENSGIEQIRYLYQKVDVIPDKTVTVDFDFIPAISGMKGTLKFNGTPTLGSVYFRFYYPTETWEDLYLRTLQDGSYSFGYLPPGKAIIQFQCEKQAICQTVTLPPNAVLELNCNIVKAASVSGSVKGANNPETDSVWILLGKLTASDFDKEPITIMDPRRLTACRIQNEAFTLKNVPPGVYTLVVVRRPMGAPRITSSNILLVQTIEVGTQNLDGIELAVVTP